MDIHHIGHSVIHTPTHDLHLNNILHVPQATKSLLSTSRLACDNHAFVEYCPNPFFVKDQDTKEVLLQGRCMDDAGRITTQLGTPRGRYDEYSSKSFPQLRNRGMSNPVGKSQTSEGDAC
jgi:hypothetical protein